MTTRRQRLVAGAAVAAAVVALAAMFVTRASNDHTDHTEQAVRATVGPTTSTASASTSTSASTPTSTSSTSVAATPASALTALRLPNAGVVVELTGANDAERGVVLVDLDGRVIARLPDGTIHTTEDTAGPLILRTGSGDYLLDPTSRRLIEQPFHDTFEIRLPLAYGARLVSRMRADPGSYAIEDGGEVVAELGNRMDTGFVVANDRDLVTVLDDDPPTVIDVRTHRRSRIPARCEGADRHGARWLLLCPSTEPSLPDTVKVQEGTHLTTLFGPADDRGGHWRSASFANDGEDVLLQWSGECETRSVYLGEATNGGSGPSGDLRIVSAALWRSLP